MKYDPPLERICEAVETVTGVTKAEMVGFARQGRVVEARRLLALAARKEIGATYPRIGHFLGRDHSIAQRLIERVPDSDQFANKYDRVMAQLEAEVDQQVANPALEEEQPKEVVRFLPPPRSCIDLTECKKLWRKGWTYRGLAKRYEVSELDVMVAVAQAPEATA